MPEYKIGLINYNFDIDERNVRLFSSKKERDDFFETQVKEWSELVNVNFDNLITTRQNYEYKKGVNVLELLNRNLAIIKKDDLYLYFFITSSKQLAGEMIELNLQIADILTYWYDLDFSDCLINRAHLNRFLDIGNNRVVFDNGKSSPLLNQELENFPKYLRERNEVYPCIDTTSYDSPINRLIRDQKITWLIVYMKSKPIVTSTYNQFVIKDKFIDNSCYVFVAPYYNTSPNTGKKFQYPDYNDQGQKTWYNWEATELIDSLQKHRAEVLNMKITPTPPLDVIRYRQGTDYEDTTNNIRLLITPDRINIPSTKQFGFFLRSDTTKLRLCQLKNQSFYHTYTSYTLNIPTQFNKSDIVNANSDSKFNPKLLSGNFRELQLTDFTGEKYAYDIQKINAPSIKINYREGMNADTTKTYGRIVELKDSVYEQSYTNYLGLMSSTDTSIPYDVNQLASFLAQNKNFQMVRGLNVITQLLPVLALLAKANPATAILSTIASLSANQLTQSLSLNNMENAPTSIQNANGSVLFNTTINLAMSLAFYIDIYEATQIDLEKANDFMSKNGFSYGKWDNINNHTKTRKKFNYIEADIDVINGQVSNDIKIRIKQKLKSGVRFWHIDQIDYTKENYERWLENGNLKKKA